MVIGVDCSTDLQSLYQHESLDGLLLRMFPGPSTATVERISEYSSKRWMNSGMAFRGVYWMQNTLEHHKDAEESTLSEVLDPFCPPRYFLSPEQLKSLLERASASGKLMPEDLKGAIEEQITILSSTPQLEESILQDRKPKDTEVMVKHTHLIQEDMPMLYARRLTPLECERLQGFPPGWTEIDIDV